MSLYAKLSHLLMQAQELVDEHEPETEQERTMLEAARLHIAEALLSVRRIHHRWRWWR